MYTERAMFSNRSLKKLILPLIMEQILAMTVGMADTMMISSAGEASISGVALVDMVNYLAVSYTHLDVYKRQLKTCACGWKTNAGADWTWRAFPGGEPP